MRKKQMVMCIMLMMKIIQSLVTRADAMEKLAIIQSPVYVVAAIVPYTIGRIKKIEVIA